MKSDTPSEVQRLQTQIWQSKPCVERMRLAGAASAGGLRAAGKLAAESRPGDAAALFLLVHGASFDPAERDRIAAAIRSWHRRSAAIA